MMKASLEDKKSFLTWFIQNNQLKRRESLWILNYLLNHEQLLKNVHFIEEVSLTNRGMGLATIESEQDPFAYYKDGRKFEDPEQAFHDLRLNWQETFYLELYFDNAYQVLSAYGILEQNPNIEEGSDMSFELGEKVESSLNRLAWKERKRQLLLLIDQALSDQNEEKFQSFTDELRKIDEKIKANDL